MPIKSLLPILFDIIFTNYVPFKKEKYKKFLPRKNNSLNTIKPQALK